KCAVVTGASAGIGKETALQLAREGAAVVLSGRRGERLQDVVREIEKQGGKALAVVSDASKTQDIDALLAKAEDFSRKGGNGKLDIVVVNAGRGLAGSLLTSDEKQWKEIYDLNVLGAGALMRRAAEIMVKQGSGDIVALGS